MKYTYNIEVDCANCANKIEGIKSVSVNFIMQKMIVNFEDNIDPKKVKKMF